MSSAECSKFFFCLKLVIYLFFRAVSTHILLAGWDEIETAGDRFWLIYLFRVKLRSLLRQSGPNKRYLNMIINLRIWHYLSNFFPHFSSLLLTFLNFIYKFSLFFKIQPTRLDATQILTMFWQLIPLHWRKLELIINFKNK